MALHLRYIDESNCMIYSNLSTIIAFLVMRDTGRTVAKSSYRLS